mgnify:CR=1 FL=1
MTRDNRALDYAEVYSELGLDSVPLRPGTKDPSLFRNWQTRDPAELWRHAPPDSNIGIRGGGEAQAAIFDCDDKTRVGTFAAVQNWLFGLGIEPNCYPVVQTASGISRHAYVSFAGTLAGHSRHFANNFGAGEFKFGNATQVAAPPSKVGEATYTLLAGDFAHLPTVTLADVLPLLADQDTTPEPARPAIPSLAWRILSGNAETIRRYKTRSEAEQACIASLINAGHDFESILTLFTQYPAAGKFAEMCVKNQRNAIKWLRKSVDEARRWTSANVSKGRRGAEEIIGWANSRPWPGRTGAVDRCVFLAHAQIAWRAGRLVYSASCRDLAELAGVSSKTATRATHRLTTADLLSLDRAATVSCPNCYQLRPCGQTDTLPKYFIVRKCVTLSTEHDAFRSRYLGKAAAEIWQLLQAEALTAEELAERTGRHLKTVRRKLDRMARIVDPVTGEVAEMLACDDGGAWHVCAGVDLDHVARLLGTSGAAKRQRARHADDRKAHRRSLALGRKKESEVEKVTV